jgi:hypothetical protein
VAERDLVGRHAEGDVGRGEGGVGVEERAVEIEDGEGEAPQDDDDCWRGNITDARLARPRYSPLRASSSQRAPHETHSQLSILSDAM